MPAVRVSGLRREYLRLGSGELAAAAVFAAVEEAGYELSAQ